jgi:SAM-dependent methyltransferase
MVMNGLSSKPDTPPTSAGTPARSTNVVWHELECGSYAADLPIWRELAALASTGADAQPLLDVGAGTGRVSLDLAGRGHLLTALDHDEELLGALRERVGELAIETVCADARSFELNRRDFAVCLVPMQTIQLLGGRAGRLEFLSRAREHLRPGGLLACAIVTDIQPFDCADGDLGPDPDVAHVGDLDYVSRPTRLHVDDAALRIERERSVTSTTLRARGRWQRAATPAEVELDVIELDRLSVAQLLREGERAGLSAAGSRSIPPTLEHVGSEVVMFRG